MNLYRIKDWAKHFENNRTKEVKSMSWVPIPTKQDGDGYTELLDHPSGAAHFGVWIAVVEVAAKCEPRGTLLRANGTPHDFASLSRLTRIPPSLISDAFKRLTVIGWIESEGDENPQLRLIPQEPATTPQEGASSRVRAHAGATQPNPTQQDTTEPNPTAPQTTADDTPAAGLGGDASQRPGAGLGGLGTTGAGNVGRIAGSNLDRLFGVQAFLKSIGAGQEIVVEFGQRRDLNAEILSREWRKVKADKSVADPVGVLVHRMRKNSKARP